MKKMCVICGKIFTPAHGKSTVCSDECKRARNRKYKRHGTSKPKSTRVKANEPIVIPQIKVTWYDKFNSCTGLARMSLISTATYQMGKGLTYGELMALKSMNYSAYEELVKSAIEYMRKIDA